MTVHLNLLNLGVRSPFSATTKLTVH